MNIVDYHLSVAIVGEATPPIWFWESWKSACEVLNSLCAATQEKIAVRSIQADENGKDIRFGRLDWDERSHMKWTHLSPINLSLSWRWGFALAEIWSPPWTICNRDARDPDLFISIENPFILKPPQQGQYNQFFHIAVRADLLKKHRLQHSVAIEKIASLVGATDIVMRLSKWNERFDCVQDVLNNHLHYLGMHNDMRLDISKTSGRWVLYDKEQVKALAF